MSGAILHDNLLRNSFEHATVDQNSRVILQGAENC